MPRNRVQTSEDIGGVEGWWSSLPPITRFFGTMWLGGALVSTLYPSVLRFLWLESAAIFQRFQIWRLFTNVTFLTGFSSKFLFNMLWWFLYGAPIERVYTEYAPGDFAFCLSFCILCLDIIGLLNPYDYFVFTPSRLIFAVLYLWSREYSSQDVSIYGLVTIKGFYLPWAFVLIGQAVGGGLRALMEDLIGIGVGHLYYFLTTIYPAQTGKRVLQCPLWLARFMSKFYKAAQPANQPAASGQGFQAFRGRGHRLRD